MICIFELGRGLVQQLLVHQCRTQVVQPGCFCPLGRGNIGMRGCCDYQEGDKYECLETHSAPAEMTGKAILDYRTCRMAWKCPHEYRIEVDLGASPN